MAENRASETYSKFAFVAVQLERRMLPFGLDPMWLSASVLALTFALIISGRLDRVVVALIDAAANVTVVGVAERGGIRSSFLHYLAYGVPMTLAAIGICHIYVWLRYF